MSLPKAKCTIQFSFGEKVIITYRIQPKTVNKVLSKLETYPEGIDDNWIVSKVCNRKWKTGGDQCCKRR